MCVLGPRGNAKTSAVLAFASMLGYELEVFPLYADITHRELLQRRVTRADGTTAWEPSPIVEAAISGRLCVVENIERLPADSLSVLQSLVQDRRLTLFDGTRLVRASEMVRGDDATAAETDDDNAKIIAIHPSFRIVATGELPTKSHRFLTPELLNMFTFHACTEGTTASDRDALIAHLVPTLDESTRSALLQVASTLDEAGDALPSLSLRQLIRMAHKLAHQQQRQPSRQMIADLVRNSLLAHYLPVSMRNLLDASLSRFARQKKKTSGSRWFGGADDNGAAQTSLGERQPPRAVVVDADDEHLIPDIEYFDVPSQAALMHGTLADDFELGEPLLLIGSMGVGKNKLIDRFLMERRLPRQYIQLHRDFTVGALTLQSNIVDGKLVTEPSPLVVAARQGHVLVLDEADKAPREVIAVLKGLLEGDMRLSDGRRLVSAERRRFYADSGGGSDGDDGMLVDIHSDFRVVVLANPPGYPFAGNDFFAELGDHFAVHVIENPDVESQLLLLRRYAPSVPVDTLRRLAATFHELRARVERGELSYPYSTRECLALAKHMERFPGDTLAEALSNVFAYDAYDDQVRLALLDALRSAGRFDIDERDFLASTYDAARMAAAAARHRIEELGVQFERSLGGAEPSGNPHHGKEDPNNDPHVGGNQWAGGTGGRDTAGLGGVGGPYRLDKGHPVHQVSQSDKDAVSDEVRQAARRIAEAELKKRLADIDLDPGAHAVYEQYFDGVRPQVARMRELLDSLERRREERVWLRAQSSGDLDDSRLVDGVAGERNIYKRRGLLPKQKLPPHFAAANDSDDASSSAGDGKDTRKCIQFVVDVSGSMYRFNSYDGRLERMLEAAVLIMESMPGFEDKISWSLVGHSGDTPCVEFVRFDEPPTDRRQRFQVLQKMVAHTQYCMSGDHTLEAARHASKRVLDRMPDAEQHFVVVLSDANLERYGIHPSQLGRILSAEPRVKAYAIFVASLFDEAERIRKSLPGQAFVCTEPSRLPNVFSTILHEFTQQ
jgi:von Willebrand factor A domain-containing protein 8